MSGITGFRTGEGIYESAGTRVLRARRDEDGAAVVIKMSTGDRPDPARAARLRHEHEILRGLSAPGVIRCLGLVLDRGQPALVLEDIGGRSLRSLAGVRMPVERFVPLAIALTSALAAVHEAGVIHKDVNPNNVIVNDETGALRLIDFGIASRLIRADDDALGPAQLEGTLAYISPEQTGRMNRAVDHRTDLYSLGVTFYELLTGAAPFRASDPMELVHSHLARTPPPPRELVPSLPQALSDLVMKLLSKTPEGRYQSASGVLHDLRRLERGEASFAVGASDASARLSIPERLFGRDAELAALLGAFERAAGGACELLLVSGYSGIGKSSLVRELSRPVTLANGYFVAGKFDQLRRDIPYEAVAQALRRLARQLALEGARRVAALREALVEALSVELSALVDVVPELELIVGRPPPAPEVPPAEAQARLGGVLRRFFGALDALGHPAVLFLDDVQWADAASLRLLRSFAEADRPRRLLVVLAYRDNEVGDDHPLRFALAELSQAGSLPVTRVSLAPLAVEGVRELLAGTLHRPGREVEPLAELLLRKTHGNPFFVNQLITALHRSGLIAFRHGDGTWQWDEEKIAHADITDNVVELMIGRIGGLSSRAQEILKLAACVGSRFELSVISALDERPGEAAAALWEAALDGLLVPLEGGAPAGSAAAYRFLHDRVQQSAYAMIPEEQRKAVRLRIGRLLLRNLDEASLEERLFDVVGHLLAAEDRIAEEDERASVGALALRAGRKARASLAYDAAARLLRASVRLLPEGEARRRLRFEALLELSQSEYLRGEFDEAARLFQRLEAQASDTLERAEVYRVQIVLDENASRFKEALRRGRECLRLFGVELDEIPSEAAVGGMIGEVMTLLGGRPIQALLDAPPLDDPARAALMEVLLSLVAPAYFEGPTVFCSVVAQMVLVSMKHGNSPLSAAAYVYFGVVMAGLGQHAVGYEFGRLAFDLLARYEAKPIRGKVTFMFGNWLNYRRHHARTDLDHLVDAFQICVDSGDLTYACYCCIGVVQVWFVVGKNLAEARREAPRWLGFARKIKALDIVDNIATVDRAFAALLGEPPAAGAHDGPETDEAFEARLDRERSVPVQVYQHHHKAFVRYILEDHAAALKASDEAEKRKGAMSGQMLVEEHAFHRSLILAEAARSAAAEQRAAYIEQIRENRKIVAAIAEVAPMNYAHKRDLIDAELASLDGESFEAVGLYDCAIAEAADNGYVHHAAVASECAARFFLRRAMPTVAKAYLTEAFHGYGAWGAVAKVAQLTGKHRALLGDALETRRARTFLDTVTVTSTSLSQSAGLDMVTVVKASQAISRELHVSRLLERLTRIVLENAGAERGYIVQSQGDELLVVSHGEASKAEVAVLQGGRIDETPGLSAAIVRHVARTQQTVVLDDACKDETYGADPHIRAGKVRSLLCLPALNLGRVSAIVYLENNLTEGCFNLSRLEVLRVLSSQIAISLDHAALYESLEEKVRARTEELRATQARLIVLERVETERQMAGGFAHEVRNALAGTAALLSQALGRDRDDAKSLPRLNAGKLEEIFHLFQGSASPEQLAAMRALLREAFDNEEHLEDTLSLVSRSVDRALLITRQILEYARTGQERQERAQVDLNHVARGLLAEVEAEFGAKGVRVDARLDPASPRVFGLESHMHSVLLNLLLNARDALLDPARQGGELLITLRTDRTEGATVVTVEDNGVGIPAENLGRIFEPFFSTKPETGTGLGLSLAKKIVSLAGGTISVDSRVGQGTRFTLAFPLNA